MIRNIILHDIYKTTWRAENRRAWENQRNPIKCLINIAGFVKVADAMIDQDHWA
jgi:hypothetical protein